MEVVEEGDYILIAIYTVTTRMTCIKMGSDESHFNVSLIVRDKVTRQRPQTTAFEEPESRAEAESNRGPSAWTAYQPNVLPLGESGSRGKVTLVPIFNQLFSHTAFSWAGLA